MHYEAIKSAVFLNRLNRFEATVLIEGEKHTVHVKNTGRCTNLLVPNREVILSNVSNPKRKTAYDLISVNHPKLGWINIDSSAPNAVVKEYLSSPNYFDYVKPEYTMGKSRFDFYMKKDNHEYLLEIKGCTLEKDGIGFFPDAPTSRGTKHLRELAEISRTTKIKCYVGFVIQINGVSSVLPNREIDQDFTDGFEEAKKAGVTIINFACKVESNKISIIGSSKFNPFNLEITED